jgi:hypothetical protein
MTEEAHLEDISVGGRILKWISKKQNGDVDLCLLAKATN